MISKHTPVRSTWRLDQNIETNSVVRSDIFLPVGSPAAEKLLHSYSTHTHMTRVCVCVCVCVCQVWAVWPLKWGDSVCYQHFRWRSEKVKLDKVSPFSSLALSLHTHTHTLHLSLSFSFLTFSSLSVSPLIHVCHFSLSLLHPTVISFLSCAHCSLSLPLSHTDSVTAVCLHVNTNGSRGEEVGERAVERKRKRERESMLIG